MTTSYDHQLQSVSAEAFSTLGFMFPMDDQQQDQTPILSPLVAQVAFDGPHRGALRVAVSPELPAVLAANMTGQDEPVPEQHQHDALMEMVNVICGNILPVIAGQEVVFNVGTPEICNGDAASQDQQGSCVAAAKLALDAGRAEMALFFDLTGSP